MDIHEKICYNHTKGVDFVKKQALSLLYSLVFALFLLCGNIMSAAAADETSSGGTKAIGIIIILLLFTVTFVGAGLITYRIRRKKSDFSDKPTEEMTFLKKGDKDGH